MATTRIQKTTTSCTSVLYVEELFTGVRGPDGIVIHATQAGMMNTSSCQILKAVSGTISQITCTTGPLMTLKLIT